MTALHTLHEREPPSQDKPRHEFISLVLNGCSINELITTGAHALSCAVLLVDRAQQPLAYHPGSARGPTIITRAHATWDENHDPATMLSERIAVRGVDVATLRLLRPARPFDLAEREIARDLSLSVALVMLNERAVEHSVRRHAHAALLRSLVNGDIAAPEFRERLCVLGAPAGQTFATLAIAFRKTPVSDTQAQLLADALATTNSVGLRVPPLACVFNGGIVAAIPVAQDLYLATTRSTVAAVECAAKSIGQDPVNLAIAVAGVTHDACDLLPRLQVATMVAGASAFETYARWYDARTPRISTLTVALGRDPRFMRIVGPYSERLRSLPEGRRDQLVQTLRAVLECGGRKADAARQLYLNRTALYKRIRVLEQTLEVDLDDGETRTLLMLTLSWMTTTGRHELPGSRGRADSPRVAQHGCGVEGTANPNTVECDHDLRPPPL